MDHLESIQDRNVSLGQQALHTLAFIAHAADLFHSCVLCFYVLVACMDTQVNGDGKSFFLFLHILFIAQSELWVLEVSYNIV